MGLAGGSSPLETLLREETSRGRLGATGVEGHFRRPRGASVGWDEGSCRLADRAGVFPAPFLPLLAFFSEAWSSFLNGLFLQERCLVVWSGLGLT